MANLNTSDMPAELLKPGDVVKGKVVDMGYCFALVQATTLNDKQTSFSFSVETYPQNSKQKTKQVNISATPERRRKELLYREALAHWVNHVKDNADGTRKGGAFAEKNLSCNNIPIGAEVKITVIENPDIKMRNDDGSGLR